MASPVNETKKPMPPYTPNLAAAVWFLAGDAAIDALTRAEFALRDVEAWLAYLPPDDATIMMVNAGPTLMTFRRRLSELAQRLDQSGLRKMLPDEVLE